MQRAEDWLRGKSPPAAAAPASPQVSIASPPVTIPPLPKPKHQDREPKEVEKVATIDPNRFIGLDPSGVAKLLGPPSTVAKGDPSLVWTYVAAGCAFRIFFYPDLKTASFHALKYGGFGGNGEQISLSQSCIRNILTVRANG